MKKRLINSVFGIMALCFGFLFSCTNDTSDPVTTEGSVEVSFTLDAKTVTKALVNDIGDCGASLDNGDLSLYLKLKKDGVDEIIRTLPLKSYNGAIKTEPLELKAGNYVVEIATVSQTILSDTKVIYSGVNNTIPAAPYAAFIPDNELMGVKSFKIGDDGYPLYTKPTITLYVLCAQHEQASNFGMPKFLLNFTEVTCVNLFVNVCNPEKDGEHEVGIGSIKVYDKKDGKLLNTSDFGEGILGTICFADNLSTEDRDETFYLELTLTNDFLEKSPLVFTGTVTVEQLLAYANASAWDESKNLFHIVYCGGEEICFNSGDNNENLNWCLKTTLPDIENFDYLVLRFSWNENNGRDLDIAYGIAQSLILDSQDYGFKPVGWAMPGNDLPYITNYFYWGKDNQGNGFEAVYIDMKKFLADHSTNLPATINLEARVNWYASRGDGDYKCELIAYKGGDMVLNNYNYENIGGASVYNDSFTSNALASGMNNYSDIATKYNLACKIVYDKATNKASISTVSSREIQSWPIITTIFTKE